jgi:hypothetical protein
VKLVRAPLPPRTCQATIASDLLDHTDLLGHSQHPASTSTSGVMAVASFGRLGLTVRNVTAPTFDTGRGDELQLETQARLGGSVLLLPEWKLAR